jgi:hypothetical protein
MVEDHPKSSPRIRCVSSPKLAHFLEREPRSDCTTDFDLNRIFRELFRRAIDFLPSDAGTIYLDDPLDTAAGANRGSLVVIATRDELTDLSNDRHLHSSLLRIVDPVFSEGTECAIIFIDLERFKEVNELGRNRTIPPWELSRPLTAGFE